MRHENPFPGMNPFMESSWPDVRLSLIGYVRDLLGVALPDDLTAKAELRVDVVGGEASNYRLDVTISEDKWKQGLPPVWSPDKGTSPATVTEPVLLNDLDAPQRWVEIWSDQGELITVIEILSPSNKTSQRDEYRAKRADFLQAGVNVVEIDLLRQGTRTVNVFVSAYEERFAHVGEHYVTCVTRPSVPGRREVYVTPLREKLPTIRIPLRRSDLDIPLDIQSLVNRTYTTGRYWKLPYDPARLTPPLAGADLDWMNALLKQAGLSQ
jgi:hypothetical protein